MRKVKSAPDNLSTMCNNKKKHIAPIIKSNAGIVEIIPPKTNNFTQIKKFKITVQNTGTIINDLITDNKLLSIEESTIINTIILYLSENITREKKINELYKYLVQSICRYIVLMFIHSTILHDNIDKYLPTINYLHTIIK
jgi:hypothetical protein